MAKTILIEYINALAGAGKTYNFARLAHRWAHFGNKVLIIQPSKELIDKTVKNEFGPLNPSYPITVIHSNNTCDVLGSIIRHMKQVSASEGEVLIITQQAFLNLPYMENKQNWHLLVDEEPPVHDCDVRNIPDTHRIITDMVEVAPLGTEYGLMTQRPGYEPPQASVIKKSLRSIAKNKSKDDMLKVIEDIAQKVTSEHWQVYAKLSAFDGLVKYKDKSQLHVHSILRPSIFEGFKRVVIAGALFEEGALFKLWSSLDSVKLVPAGSDIVKGLRYHQHQNGHLLTIKYLIDEPWSKTKRDKIIELDGIEKAAIEYIRDLIGTHLSDKPFVWMGNTDLEDDFFGGLDATRLPNSPHGLNGYTKYDHAVVLSALNPPSSHFKFMVWKGVSEDELRTAIYRSAVYQAIMRISLRDPDSTTQKSVVVMDKATAVWLSNFFAGSKVQLINGKQLDLQSKAPHRPRIHENNSDKNRVYKTRRAKKKRLLEDIVRLNSNLRVHPDGRELTLAEKFETGTDDQIYGTVFSSVRAYYGADKLMCRSNEEFIGFLKLCHRRTVRSKEENFLISPSVFNPNIPGVESKRGRDNVVFSRGIWLDNDGGGITPSEFARLFPRLRIVTFNTNSSTASCPHWRAFIPTSCAMTPEVSRLVTQQILRVLRNAGYAVKSNSESGKVGWKGGVPSGFDESKYGCHSLFYAPSQARDPEGTFFLDYNSDDRAELDVMDTIRQCYPDDLDEPILEDVNVAAQPSQVQHLIAGSDEQEQPSPDGHKSRREAAIERWRSTPKGEGHNAFLRLGIDLNRAGLDQYELRAEMQVQSNWAHSPTERRRDVPGIVNWVGRKFGRRAS